MSYSKIIKENRDKFFPSPYDLVYSCFEKLGLFKKNQSFFIKNASSIIEQIREESWNTYLPIERKFMSETLAKLINEDEIKDKKPLEAIEWFIDSFPQEIYDLSLSNTQSRRSRAGKEFEAIIELLLIGAGIEIDSQANIGT
ncbi:restriction endonuclease, partial [bacterium]|nr:restriction endonuclease [bacterium]